MQLFGGKGKMLGLLLVLAAFGSFYLGDITAFTTSQKAIAGVALFIIVLSHLAAPRPNRIPC